jgi:hypothetical protein
MAYGVTTVQGALVAIWNGRAEAVNHADDYSYETYSWEDWAKLRPADGDTLVRSGSAAFVAPQVVRMLDFKAMPKRGVTCSRINILKRDEWQCQYCSCRLSGETMHLDHVVPRSQGGITEWTNVVACCYPCNQKKRDRTPRQAGMPLLKKPVKPDWTPDFAIHASKYRSWSKFLADAYWNVPLQT